MIAAPSREDSRHFYVPELDGLRFLAFLAVFMFHVPPLAYVPRTAWRWDSLHWWGRSVVLSGAFGVDLFFVLSSFLITSLLVREANARGQTDVPAFWIRRALRIWPVYYVYVALCAVVEGAPATVVAAYSAFVANWPFIGPRPEQSLFGLLWSLQIEEQFYLAWPLVLVVVPRGHLRAVCVGMLVVSLSARGYMLAEGAAIERVWSHTLTRLDPLAIGALIALTWRERPSFGPALTAAVGGVGVLFVVVSTGLLSHELLRLGAEGTATKLVKAGAGHLVATVLVFLVVAVACGGVLLAALSARGSWLGHPALVYLGRISYGLYVFHVASLSLFNSLWWPWRGLFGLGITILAAALSYRFLERPFLRLKDRLTYIRSAPGARDIVELRCGASSRR